ncbi:MAG TPA: PIN domain-containing protein [Acidimicrobiales bacterium]|nr:PIN domain-containing protein [Acidimicrobiales bacterium]
MSRRPDRFVLDAGALISFERNKRATVALVQRIVEHGGLMAVPAGVLAQVWRDGRHQARLARLLASDCCEVVPLDDRGAREAGQLLGVTGTSDVVDATVVRCARRRELAVITSDRQDLRRLDQVVRLIPV